MQARRGQRSTVILAWPSAAGHQAAAVDAHIIRRMRQEAGYYDNGITAERIDAAIDNPENNVFILLRRGDVTVAVLAALANAAPIGGGEVEIFLDFIIAMPGYGRALMRELVYNFAVSLGPGPTHSMAVTICTCATPEAEPFFRHLGFKRTRLISFGPLPMVLRLDFP